MKKKITKIKSSKNLTERLNGIATWRITGPSVLTSERVNVEFFGTRKEAEQVVLI